MSSYRVLVVDDQPIQTESLFHRLFEGDDRFAFTQANKALDFTKADFLSYDMLLLDVNLDSWGITLDEALGLVGNQCPIVLVSRFWDKERTHRKITESLSSVKSIHFIATLVLNDLLQDDWKDKAESMRSQLLLAIEKQRKRGLLDLQPDDPIHILHLSDPQYGDKNTDDWATFVEDEIGRLVLEELDINVHFIAITGDISFSGEPQQYALAEEKLSKLAQQFLPARKDWRERLLLVPGNHDINLLLASADRIKVEIQNDGTLKVKCTPQIKKEKNFHQNFSLSPFREFAWKLTGDSRWRDSPNLSWVNNSFLHLGVRFFMLNSTATIDCHHPQKAGFLSNELEDLGYKKLSDTQPFGIAFSHHGPPELTDNSNDTLSNWPNASKFMQTRGIKLFLHGHGHKHRADKFNLAKQETLSAKGLLGKNELLRVMAPTTHLNGKLRPEGERRGVNIITLYRSHGVVEKVKVDSYEFSEDLPHKADGAPWEVRT